MVPSDEPPSDERLVRQEALKEMLEEGRLVEALKHGAAARADFPDDAQLISMLAYAHLRMGDIAEAMAFATEALGLAPGDPASTVVLGTAHRHLGNNETAAELLMEATRLLPDRVDVAEMAIEETAAAHGVEAAVAAFKEIYERLPDHGLAVNVASALFNAGEYHEPFPGLVPSPILSVPDWLAQQGLSPDWVGEREAQWVEDPPIFGESPEGRFKADVPGYVSYVATIRDARIYAKSSLVLTPDGAALSDTLTDERFGHLVALPHDLLVVGRQDDQLLLDLESWPLETLDAGIMLSGWASDHFGHWLPEFLFRLGYMRRHPRFAELPIIVDDGMPPQHLEYLRLVVSNPIVEIPAGQGLRVGELVVASPTTFFPAQLKPGAEVPDEHLGGASTEGANFVRDQVQARLPPAEPASRKLYLSRKNSTWRRLLNDQEIGAALARRGFEVVYPEEMTVEEQVRMYQSARIVVAPNGSSLLNMIYGPPDMVVITLSQRGLFNQGTFYGFIRAMDRDLTFLCSDEETQGKHDDYSIPIAALLRAIEVLSGEAGADPGALPKIPVARPRLPQLAALAPYIERIDAARWYSNFGPLSEEFEARLAARFGLHPSCVGTVSNATVGLELALKASGARAGTLCLVPSWTFSASVHAVMEAGLIPCFVDVGPDGVLTPHLARQAWAQAPGEVGAVMPVAYCGQPIDPAPWDDFYIETGVPAVLDSAPGFDGARAGEGLSAVSLHATKVLGVGEGGFVMSTDPRLVASVRLKANFGFYGSRIAQTPATNGKLSEYAAAIGLAGLDEWDQRRAAFQAVALRYCENLADVPGANLPEGWGRDWISATCVVRLDDPADTMPTLDTLQAARVETRAWWGRGMHTHPAFADCPRLPLPMTEHLAETVLGLPFYIDMSDDEVDRVCAALRKELLR